jgi:hypothetical protein
VKAVIGVALLWFGLPVASIACSCVVPPGSEKTQVTREFNEANAVFLGYVHSEIVRTVADNPNYSDEEKEMRAKIGVERERLVRVRVLQVWKGDLRKDSWIEMLADDGGGSGCGCAASARDSTTGIRTGLFGGVPGLVLIAIGAAAVIFGHEFFVSDVHALFYGSETKTSNNRCESDALETTRASS